MSKWFDIVKLLLTYDKLRIQELILLRREYIQKLNTFMELNKLIFNVYKK